MSSFTDYFKNRLTNLFVVILVVSFVFKNWTGLLFIFKESDSLRLLEYLHEYPIEFPTWEFGAVFGTYIASIAIAAGLEWIVDWVKAKTKNIALTPTTESFKLRQEIRRLNSKLSSKESEAWNLRNAIKNAVLTQLLEREIITTSVRTEDIVIIPDNRFEKGTIFHSPHGTDGYSELSFPQIRDRADCSYYLSLYAGDRQTIALALKPDNGRSTWLNAAYFVGTLAKEAELYSIGGPIVKAFPTTTTKFMRFTIKHEFMYYGFNDDFFT